MKSSALQLAASAAFFLSAVPSLAATVIFDDFTDIQVAVDGPGGSESTSTSIVFGSGTRTLTATNTQQSGSSSTGDTRIEVDAGSLAFSNAAGARGRGEVQYTNVGDISIGANPFFLFGVGDFDRVAVFFAEAVDIFNNVSTYTELLQPGFDPQLFFSQFSPGADFNNLSTLTFAIDSTTTEDSVDGVLDSISISAVPLPAGGFLLIAGLGGLAALRRRKRA